jgi:Sec-independent protein translocase protein TatA
MRIFNVGLREVILLLVIMLVLFGPRQMQENARKMAQGIRRFVRSDTWRTFLGLYDDLNNIKDQVIRESGIRDVQDSLRGVNRQLYDLDRELQQNSRIMPEDPAGSDNQTAGSPTNTSEPHEQQSD